MGGLVRTQYVCLYIHTYICYAYAYLSRTYVNLIMYRHVYDWAIKQVSLCACCVL